MHPVIGMSAFATAVAVYAFPAIESAALSVAFVITALVLARKARAFVSICALTVPYALGAYVGFLNGRTFFPYPSAEGYWSASKFQLATVLLVLGLGLVTPLGGILQLRLRAAADGVLAAKWSGKISVSVSMFAAVGIGIHDAWGLYSNRSIAFGINRHLTNESMWVGSGPIGIFVSLTITLLLGAVCMSRVEPRGARTVAILALLVMWLPSIVAGNRHYAAVASVAALTIWLTASSSTRRQRTILLIGAGVGVAGFTLLPSFWAGDIAIGFNEWILPNSLFLPLILDVYDGTDLGITPFLEQWVILIPTPFTPYSVTTFSSIFESLGVTEVAVGGNPWAETYYPDSPLLSGLLVSLCAIALIAVASLLSRRHVLILPLSIGLLAFWGRSLFWETLTAIIFCFALLYLLNLIDMAGVRARGDVRSQRVEYAPASLRRKSDNRTRRQSQARHQH